SGWGHHVLGSLARASTGTNRYFVFAYFSGGWDLLLCLDPRDPDRFTDEDDVIQRTQIQTGYSILGVRPNSVRGVLFGPFMGEFDSTLLERSAVVRGMSMETLTHEVGRRRFLTGKAPAGLQARGSSASTWLAFHVSRANPIPNLVFRVESFNADLPPLASALIVQSVGDLVQILNPQNPTLPSFHQELIHSFLEEQLNCPRARFSTTLRKAREAWERMQSNVVRRLGRLFDFRTPLNELYPENSTERRNMEEVRRHFFGENGAPWDSSEPIVQAAAVAQALINGVSSVITFEAARGLDTHLNNWRTEHGRRLAQGWTAVARLAKFLSQKDHPSGGKWLDRTTILCFSEFMRTPYLNERGGRDHWLTNACLLIGGGIRPGVIGASSDFGMAPLPVDLESGALSPTGVVIRPEHIIRTLFELAGISEDIADLRVPPLRALLA
ncbi:MAG: DUF1501 domain-containing protein, partial [Deltaproteobacteria bacterium]|nr:DUF1501 domain-containing protein [Deltaproteobacteria bacterium]